MFFFIRTAGVNVWLSLPDFPFYTRFLILTDSAKNNKSVEFLFFLCYSDKTQSVSLTQAVASLKICRLFKK